MKRSESTVAFILAAIIAIVAGVDVAVLAVRTGTPVVDVVTQLSSPRVGIDSLDDQAPTPAPVPTSSPTPTPSATETTPPRPPRPVKTTGPVRVMIPAIGVDAYIVDLGLDADKRLEVPTDFADAGWWTDGARPGEVGPSIIVGHVASRRGPGVFFNLTKLKPGDEVIVEQADAPTERFVVQWGATYAKDKFPTNLVYGDTAEPTLRLITCSGTFDRGSGHYLDNHVVFLQRVPSPS